MRRGIHRSAAKETTRSSGDRFSHALDVQVHHILEARPERLTDSVEQRVKDVDLAVLHDELMLNVDTDAEK
jgi:hypothetical protein